MATIERRLRLANNAGGSELTPLLAGLSMRAIFAPFGGSVGTPPTWYLRPKNYGTDTDFDVTSLVSPAVAIDGSANGTLSDIGQFSALTVTNWATEGIAAGDVLLITDTSGVMKTGLYEVYDTGVANASKLRLLNPYRDDGQLLWPFTGAITGLSWAAAWTLVFDTSRPEVQSGSVDNATGAYLAAVEHVLDVVSGGDTYRSTFFIRNCSNANLVWLDGTPHDGFTTTKQDKQRIAIDFCRDAGFLNRGGIGTVEIASGTGFFWDPAHAEQGEITLAQALRTGVYVSAGTGTKTATFRLRARRGDATYKDVAVSISVTAAIDPHWIDGTSP